MNPHEEKLSKALVLVGELMGDVVEDSGAWGEDCKCAYMVDQLEEAYDRLDKARKLLREA